MLRKSFAAIAALAMIAGSSTAAIAQSAGALSLSNAPAASRAGATVSDENELGRRGIGIYIIGAVVLAAVIYGIIQLTDDDEPDSP